MRYSDILNERRIPDAIKAMSNADRIGWITFLERWLSGHHMTKFTPDVVQKWEAFSAMFPTGLTGSVPLYRVITVPIAYADQKTFEIARPAPNAVGSWTSTKVGMDCVAGVAREINHDYKTARIGIAAMIPAEDILVSAKTMKQGFLSLTHDFEYEDETYPNKRVVKGVTHWGKAVYPSYLDHKDDELYREIGYLQALFRDVPGGPYRQSEFIVRTKPVQARLIYVYRRGTEYEREGNDDPHNY